MDNNNLLLESKKLYTKDELFKNFLHEQTKTFLIYIIEAIVVLIIAIIFTILKFNIIYSLIFYLISLLSIVYIIYVIFRAKKKINNSIKEKCRYDMYFYNDRYLGIYRYSIGQVKIDFKYQDILKIIEKKNCFIIKTNNLKTIFYKKSLENNYDLALKIIKEGMKKHEKH